MPGEIIVLFIKCGLKLLKLAFALGQGFLALANGFVLLSSGFSLAAFQFGPIILNLKAFALDCVALRRKFLILELLFEIPLPRCGLVIFLLKFGDFFRDIGRLFVAARCCKYHQRGDRDQG